MTVLFPPLQAGRVNCHYNSDSKCEAADNMDAAHVASPFTALICRIHYEHRKYTSERKACIAVIDKDFVTDLSKVITMKYQYILISKLLY